MEEEIMGNEDLAKLKAGLRGAVIGRDDEDYDEARKLYNGMIDKRPLLIALCADVADVIAAVNFGRDNGLLVAIRGGGHSGPGLGSCDDGLVIDLSTMKGVRVDPAAGTVRVGPGCTSGDVDHATHAFEVVRGGTSNIVSSNQAVELTAGPRSLAAPRAM
jgi:FAD/FMN-containing dehydrogenase